MTCPLCNDNHTLSQCSRWIVNGAYPSAEGGMPAQMQRQGKAVAALLTGRPESAPQYQPLPYGKPVLPLTPAPALVEMAREEWAKYVNALGSA